MVGKHPTHRGANPSSHPGFQLGLIWLSRRVFPLATLLCPAPSLCQSRRPVLELPALCQTKGWVAEATCRKCTACCSRLRYRLSLRSGIIRQWGPQGQFCGSQGSVYRPMGSQGMGYGTMRGRQKELAQEREMTETFWLQEHEEASRQRGGKWPLLTAPQAWGLEELTE